MRRKSDFKCRFEAPPFLDDTEMKVAVTTLAFCVAALLALGMVMLYSSSMTQFGAGLLKKQLEWFAFGFVLCVVATMLDYQLLKKFAWPIFIVAVILLVAVLVPHIGRKINGARRWFDFHGFRYQPSELAKIALIIVLAWYGTAASVRCKPGSEAFFCPAQSSLSCWASFSLSLIAVLPSCWPR